MVTQCIFTYCTALVIILVAPMVSFETITDRRKKYLYGKVECTVQIYGKP